MSSREDQNTSWLFRLVKQISSNVVGHGDEGWRRFAYAFGTLDLKGIGYGRAIGWIKKWGIRA